MKTNEKGIGLDRAGYAPSILEPARPVCALCGRSFGVKLDRHEPWGAANRQKSKELGLWVSLCHWGCHEGPGSVHADAEKNRELRRRAQAQAMAVYGWDLAEWRRRFGKSELAENEDPFEVSPAGGTLPRRNAEDVVPYGGRNAEDVTPHKGETRGARRNAAAGFRVTADVMPF